MSLQKLSKMNSKINDIIGCSDGKTSLIEMAEYFAAPFGNFIQLSIYYQKKVSI